MPTPTSGAISMLNMRTEITRGTGAISMSEVRDRYGGSGAISFNSLYKTEGFVITAGQLVSKFFTINGYNAGGGSFLTVGSVTPQESNNRVQFAAAAFLQSIDASAGQSNSNVRISPDNTGGANGNAVTAGFKVTDITRCVVANTSRTLGTAAANNTTSLLLISYQMPSSGTLHSLIQF
jgi:hypothetical protein